MSEYISTNEAIVRAEELKNNAESRAQQIEMEKEKLDRESKYLQNYIYDNANPSPILVAIVVVAIVLVVWLVFVVGAAPNASGEWYDEHGMQWIIEHNRWNNNNKVWIDGTDDMPIDIVDNMIKFKHKLGVWDYRNTILWVDGGSLERVGG